jgi:ferredoxin-NADP reductase
MEEMKLELIEIITHCCDVKTFRFELIKEVFYKPGQYLIFTLNIGAKVVSKAFSISSSPTEKGYIEFTKKVTDSDYSKALDRLVVGQQYQVRLPAGQFTFTGEYPKIAFLSGGIGITPIRSILKYATDRQLSSRITLLYSSRTPEYLTFRNDFTLMQKVNKNLKIVYTLTNCTEKVQGCHIGIINEELVKLEIPDYEERVFYVCGPPGMVSAMRAMLVDELSVSPKKVITENFIGY